MVCVVDNAAGVKEKCGDDSQCVCPLCVCVCIVCCVVCVLCCVLCVGCRRGDLE